MTTTYTHRTVRPAETYRGRTFEILETVRETVKTERYEVAGTATYLTVKWAGAERLDRAPAGTADQVAKKLRAGIDRTLEDGAVRPQLLALISDDVAGTELLTGAPAVGDVVFVHAMGRYRRGLVVKVAKTRATVAFTTPSSAGRIFRKADAFGGLRAVVEAAPAPAPVVVEAAPTRRELERTADAALADSHRAEAAGDKLRSTRLVQRAVELRSTADALTLPIDPRVVSKVLDTDRRGCSTSRMTTRRTARTPRTDPAAGRQLALDLTTGAFGSVRVGRTADEDGAQLDLLEAVAEATAATEAGQLW